LQRFEWFIGEKNRRVVELVKTEGLEKGMELGAADISLTFLVVWIVRSDLLCSASGRTQIWKNAGV
jgi:hypothetical protein